MRDVSCFILPTIFLFLLLLLSFILPLPLCFPSPSNPLLLPSPPGYQNIDLELKTPSDLSYEPPTPLRSDDFFFSEGDSSADTPSRTTPTRPSDLSITPASSKDLRAAAPEAPIIQAEDTALSGEEREETARAAPQERPENDRRAVEKFRKGTQGEGVGKEPKAERDDGSEPRMEDGTPGGHHRNGLQQEEEEEDEEMTQERLRSLLEDIKLEGGLDDVEMTEEGVRAILEQVRQAERDVCSVPGWRSEASGGVVVQATGPGHTPAKEGR